MLAGDAERALQQYDQALALKPGLMEDDEFRRRCESVKADVLAGIARAREGLRRASGG